MAHAWVLLGLYSCAALGTPPTWTMWLPTASACEGLRTAIVSGNVPFSEERPASRWECRPAEATRESGECQFEWGGGEGWGQ